MFLETKEGIWWKGRLETLVGIFEKERELVKNKNGNIKKLREGLKNIIIHYMGEDNYHKLFGDVWDLDVEEILNADILFADGGMRLKSISSYNQLKELRIDNIMLDSRGSAAFIRNSYVDDITRLKEMSDFIDKNTVTADKGIVKRGRLVRFDSFDRLETFSIVSTLTNKPALSEINPDSDYAKLCEQHNLKIADIESSKDLKEYFKLNDDATIYEFDAVQNTVKLNNQNNKTM